LNFRCPEVSSQTLTSSRVSVLVFRLVEAALGLVALFTLPAFFRALILYSGNKALANEDKVALSERQRGLLGLKTSGPEQIGMGEQIKKPPKAKPSTPSEPIVPIRKSSFSYTPPRSIGQSRIGSTHLSPGGERLNTGLQMSPSTPLQKFVSSPSTPWSRKSSGSAKGIQTEVMLDQFLASLDENIDKIMDSETKAATPPATITSFGLATPISVAASTTPSGATRSTPLRPVRMSPGSHQKYSTPPKKGEGELPPPMSLEQAVEAFGNLGVYPEIEQWRDNLRQWFSSVVMNPLVQKIRTSHIQVLIFLFSKFWREPISLAHNHWFIFLNFIYYVLFCRLSRQQPLLGPKDFKSSSRPQRATRQLITIRTTTRTTNRHPGRPVWSPSDRPGYIYISI
jgi:hypothetical protein